MAREAASEHPESMILELAKGDPARIEAKTLFDAARAQDPVAVSVPARVIEQSQIERTYGHQLFNGTRRPSRDKVLQLAIGMGLNVEETQKLLRAAGKSPLYPRLRRDAVILFGIRKSFSIIDVQEALAKYRLTTLGGQRDGGE